MLKVLITFALPWVFSCIKNGGFSELAALESLRAWVLQIGCCFVICVGLRWYRLLLAQEKSRSEYLKLTQEKEQQESLALEELELQKKAILTESENKLQGLRQEAEAHRTVSSRAVWAGLCVCGDSQSLQSASGSEELACEVGCMCAPSSSLVRSVCCLPHVLLFAPSSGCGSP